MNFLQAIRADSESILHTTKRDPLAPVPACPGWNLVSLLAHVGGNHRYWTENVRTGVRPNPDDVQEVGLRECETYDDAWLESVWDWFNTGVENLIAILETEAADKPVWNWSGQNQTRSFWNRRMAHETAVHRCDADSAFGEPSPMPSWL